ncbi:hypothetical protein RF11_09103 [Thelohanellus kitauei]|uniref:ISXO2-like transposase domain-containing protein n=1 Tax=Thelohanellus kitauei TaxID=669202 RepID=A0A0C2NH90_THEKT|nr:hypothetical protein RF11_09103 [Thelohanellus kitauei]
MELTERRNRPTLREVILRNVEPGSIIQTDSWAAYHVIETYNYVHEIVIRENQYVSVCGVHTNRIEATWGAWKRLFRSMTNKRRDLSKPSYILQNTVNLTRQSGENVDASVSVARYCIYPPKL